MWSSLGAKPAEELNLRRLGSQADALVNSATDGIYYNNRFCKDVD